MPLRGVYFLANDSILDLAIAFLNSFRACNPTIKLCLIPFDDRIDSISSLRDSYRFDVFSEAALLERCDRISERFHGKILGHYRKLVAWEGPFDQFVYIDSDTVVLENLDFVFEQLTSFDFVSAVSNIPSIRKWVWKDSVEAAGLLAPQQIAWSANTGFITSSRHAVRLDEVEANLQAALDLAPHMELRCMEQPFLNYVIVTSGKRYASLFAIGSDNKNRSLPIEKWGGQALGLIIRGRVVYPKSRPILFVHWAGCWAPTPVDRRLFAIRRQLGLATGPPRIRMFLRNRRLWFYYRTMRGSEPTRNAGG